MLFRRGLKDMPVQGQRHFVGGDHGLPHFQGPQHVLGGGGLAAHEFQHHFNAGVIRYLRGVGGQQFRGNDLIPLLLHVPHQDTLDIELHVTAVQNVGLEFIQQFPHAAADVAAAQETHGYFAHAFFLSLFSGSRHQAVGIRS